ncbi:MAG: flagellar export protein FliJ [Gallionellales bacterium GWA2_55_18]|nr:MAG: flagellar export protein FliJ [Gallionellales bacterium GWA2_55_18]
MAKPFSLQSVMNLAQHQNDSATRKLGHLNKQQLGTQQQLEILRQYRRDYQARLQESTQDGMNPAELRNFQEFINKIDEAIAQQIQAVEQSKVSTQAGRVEFDLTRRRLKSFDMLHQRHIEEQKKIAEKSEQKSLDEHTNRLSARKMLNTENSN